MPWWGLTFHLYIISESTRLDLNSENSVDVEQFADALNRDGFDVAVVDVLHLDVVSIDDVEDLGAVEQLISREPDGTHHAYKHSRRHDVNQRTYINQSAPSHATTTTV